MSDTTTTTGVFVESDRPGDAVDPEARTFSLSLMVSAVRCLVTYLVLPFVLPLIGLSDRVGPVVGLVLGLIAMAANVWSIQRFWAVDHRLKWLVTVVSSGVLILLAVLVVNDIRELI